jgi:hypothetical protein
MKKSANCSCQGIILRVFSRPKICGLPWGFHAKTVVSVLPKGFLGEKVFYFVKKLL